MELHTERLVLRPVEESDAESLSLLMDGVEAEAGLLPHSMYSEEAVTGMIQSTRSAMQRGERFDMVIVLTEISGVIGIVRLRDITPDGEKAELGYWIGRDYQGFGYATEAARCMVEFGFRELGLKLIEADCVPENAASARVLEKCGFTFTGRTRHEIVKYLRYIELLHYRLDRADFKSL